MKILFLFLIFLNLYADDNKTINIKQLDTVSENINTIAILEFQKQYINLNNKVMDIDTNLEKTNKDIVNTDNKLEMQKKYYQELLNNQNTRFENLMETERWIFGLIGGFFLVIFAIMSFLGNKFINRKINKLTKKEYQDNLVKNIKNSFIEDEDLQRAVISEIIKNKEFNTKIQVLVKGDDGILNESVEKPEAFKGLSNGEEE
jgi:ABC-type antimicrobial peptide transport system permease subunit